MPRRIVLHPGFHKTGTTTLQNTLRQNREALKKHVGLRLRWHLKDLVAAARGYSTWGDPLTLLKVQDRFYRMLDALPGMPRRVLVISCEELLGHLPGRGDLRDYGSAATLLYAYWEILQERFPNAEVVIYLTTRAPAPWLASAYFEHVKASDMTMEFSTFRDTYQRAAALDAVVADIASRVPARVISAALEDCTTLPLGPADPLLDHCDIPDDLRRTLIPARPANQNPGADVLQQLLAINRAETDPDRRQAAKKAVLAKALS